MVLTLENGKYLHTAYAISDVADELLENEWSTISRQDGMDYVGTYIDDSPVDSLDATDYEWEELFDLDVDDTDDDGEMPVAEEQSQIASIEERLNIFEQDVENIEADLQTLGNNVESASQTSASAQDIAQATNMHFWSDDNGAHVSTEEGNSEGERNVLLNAFGMLFRAGANWLLGVLAGGSDGTGDKGLAIYDGEGYTDANLLAKFTQKVMQYLRNGVELFSLETSLENDEVEETVGLVCDVYQETDTVTTELTFLPTEVIQTKLGFSGDSWRVTDSINLANGQTQTVFNQSGNTCTAKMEVVDNSLVFTVTMSGTYNLTGIQGTVTYNTEDDSVSRIYLGGYPSKKPINAITVGNGKADDDRSNAFEVSFNGDGTFAGGVSSLVNTSLFGSTLRVTEQSSTFPTSSGDYGSETHSHIFAGGGYFPIAVCGYRFLNHHATLQNVYRVHMSVVRTGLCEVSIGRRDISSDSTSNNCTMYTWVLWAKES